MYKEDIKKYKTNRRYLSQYGFHNKAKNQKLARDLFLWYKNKNNEKPILAV